MNRRYLADLGERAGRSFIQGFLGLWLANPNQPVEFDTLFTLDNLKAGVVMATLSIGMALLGKGVGNPDSASVLPPEAQPPAPQPPVAADPASVPVEGVLTAAAYSHTRGSWSTVYIHSDEVLGGGFHPTGENHENVPVVEWAPDPQRHGYVPLSLGEMRARGLRPAIPEPW